MIRRCRWRSSNLFIALLRDFNSCFSYVLARLMNLRSSSDGAKDFAVSIGLKRYRPSNVLTLDRTTYSQLANTTLFVKLGQDVIMIESLERPCSLWPVAAVDIFTGSSVICRLIVVWSEDTLDGVIVTVTPLRSGLILNRRFFLSVSSSRFIANNRESSDRRASRA